jgi:hypothetical protein
MALMATMMSFAHQEWPKAGHILMEEVILLASVTKRNKATVLLTLTLLTLTFNPNLTLLQIGF